MKIIKLMADYHCHPLWGTTPENFGDIPPESLPISKYLINQLYEWAKKFDSILDMDDPSLSGFATKDEEMVFIQEGYELAHKLQIELGSDYKIIYHSDY